jgi:hypothetical protein
MAGTVHRSRPGTRDFSEQLSAKLYLSTTHVDSSTRRIFALNVAHLEQTKKQQSSSERIQPMNGLAHSMSGCVTEARQTYGDQ